VDLRGTIDRLWPDLRGGAPAPGLRVTSDRWRAMMARIRAAGPAYARLDAARSAAARALAAGDRAAAAAARTEIAAAGALLPGHALFPAVEGSLLLALGDRPGARAALARAVRLQPDLLLARERSAALEEADGRLTAAAAEARAAAALDPGSPGPRLLLGGILERSGDGRGAAAAFAEAARVAAPGSPEERRALARLAALEARPAPPAAAPGRSLR
jgi:tetratricopeptide (TPR) repeat protein